jgi:hypothetical protein
VRSLHGAFRARKNMRSLAAIIVGVGGAVLCIGLTLSERDDSCGVRSMGRDEIMSLIGGVCRDCKTDGQAGAEVDCQQCVKTGQKSSRRYNKGPVGKICVTIEAEEYLTCSMLGAIVCGGSEAGGKWLYWSNLNEDCLGMPNGELPGSYVIQTASGDDCP